MKTAAALTDEAVNIFKTLPTRKMCTVIQFARFIAQQPDESFEVTTTEHSSAISDIDIINENADSLNEGAEENLEFQADI